MDQHEEFFYCPHCAQRISVLVDLSVPEQKYIEDCEICCRPMQITYQVFFFTVLEEAHGQQKSEIHFFAQFLATIDILS